MELFDIAWNNIRRRKGRVLLLVLGLTIGVTTVVALQTITRGKGADRAGIVAQVTGQAAAAGLNILDLESDVGGTESHPIYILQIEGLLRLRAMNPRGLARRPKRRRPRLRPRVQPRTHELPGRSRAR